MEYMKIAIPQTICLLFIFFFSDKFAYFISYVESKTRLPSAPKMWVFCPSKNAISPT